MEFSNNFYIETVEEETGLGAIEIANSYLSRISQNEFADDEVQKFYGYYTIDTVNRDGVTIGMLSVNGFTGEVWYHNWHGTFIEMKEY